MYQQLLSQSPLTALPLAALFLFGLVFVAAVIRAYTTNKATLDSVAALPLAHDFEAGHDV
jgi:cbb3-type cytochrome oxidase subunit 3